MNITKARSLIISVFVISFVIITLLVIIPFAKGYYGSESLLNLMQKILIVYSIHLGVISGGIFGQGASEKKLTSPLAFNLAFIMSLIWNILLIWRCISFNFIETDTTDVDLAQYIDNIAPASSFLVSGALAYFFATQK